MDKRKDAVLGLSKLILKLDNLQKENPNIHFDFLGVIPKNGDQIKYKIMQV